MLIYHHTSLESAKKIIAESTIRASNLSQQYPMNWGPFFFVADLKQVEKAAIRAQEGVDMFFECHLPALEVSRTSDFNTKLNEQAHTEFWGKILFEMNPYLERQVMQARIIPDVDDCLRLTKCRPGTAVSRKGQQWCMDADTGGMFSVKKGEKP